MLTRCDGGEEEDEGDAEGPENLVKGLTHQCSLALRVQGLPTGFCRDIHGQVCVFECEEMIERLHLPGNVLASCNKHQCCVFSGGSVLEAETEVHTQHPLPVQGPR